MADDIIASAKAMTSVTEGQYQTLGLPKGGLTPATLTAMAGLSQGGGLQVPDAMKNMVSSMQSNAFSQVSAIPELSSALTSAGITSATALNPTALSSVLATVQANANVSPSAQAAISSLTGAGSPLANMMAATSALSTLQSKLLPAGNPAAFGDFLLQAKSHVLDSIDIKKAVNAINAQDFSTVGAGATNMSSMVDRGLTATLGSTAAAGAALKATGTMMEGTDPAKMGTPGALVESMTKNKLANATGLNAKLAAAGVNLDDIHNPVYTDKIQSVLSSIKDPVVLNVAADQFNQTPFAGLPSYSGSDSSLYTANPFGGAAAQPGFNQGAVEGSVTQGSSTASTALGAGQAAAVGSGGGGLQSLRNLKNLGI
jgi:hypothetical protein